MAQRNLFTIIADSWLSSAYTKDSERSLGRLLRARFVLLISLIGFTISGIRLFEYSGVSQTLFFISTLFLTANLLALLAIRKSPAIEWIAFGLITSLISLEAIATVVRGSFFNSFYALLPLSIVNCFFLSGRRFGGLMSLIVIAEGLLVSSITQKFGLTLSAFDAADTFPLNWQLQFLVMELFGAFAVIVATEVRNRSEAEILDRRMIRAKTTRKAALAEVVGNLAHELNNPLAIVHGSVIRYQSELKRGTLDPQMRANLWEYIEDGSQRIESLVGGLRTFAGGDTNEPMQEVVFQTLYRQADQQLREKARSFGLKIGFREAKREMTVVCRPKQILFVLTALLDNACDALKSSTEPRRIEVSCRCEARFFRVEILDNGPGIDDTIVDRLFQPFVTSKSLGTSLGMGLSACRGIIEEHGGRIRFARSGGLTRFWFELPLYGGETT